MVDKAYITCIRYRCNRNFSIGNEIGLLRTHFINQKTWKENNYILSFSLLHIKQIK